MRLREKPISGKIYHIYNRGVEKRDIFINDPDRSRFMHALNIFNDVRPILNTGYFFDRGSIGVGPRYAREKLVKILAFALMPNHYHFILEQIAENGISEFMKKIGAGYTGYFNKKYNRVGPLFQGKYKSVVLNDQAHFMYLPYYIHLNPLEMMEPEWKERKIKSINNALSLLENYKWSSHNDYLGKKSFDYLLDKDLYDEFFETPEKYAEGIKEWVDGKITSNLEKEIILE